MSIKLCVFGAGAIGGHLAARLCATDAGQVSVVARDRQLDAIRATGLTLRSGGSVIRAIPVSATQDPSTLPAQDLVFVALKAHALPGAADAIANLIAPGGCAVFLLNGIPWWWHHGIEASAGTLPLLDPDGSLWRHIGSERVIGAVVYSPNEVVKPGVIVHSGSNRILLGEPDGSASSRVATAVDLLCRAGFESRSTLDIRREILTKLLRNASGNVLAALARTDLAGVHADPGLSAVSARIVHETMAVAAALGWDLRSTVDVDEIAGAPVGNFRPSMLQDVLAGRPLETEAVLGQIHAFARTASVPIPSLDVVLPLLRGLDRSDIRRAG